MKKTVDNKRADISQIQKYLNGELDARAMHKLEREAQGDPLLMDALEGYGNAKNDQQETLASLQQRLHKRTNTKVLRIMPWTVTAIAASIFGFAVIVGLLYKGNNVVQVQQVAVNKPVKKETRADTTPVAIDKSIEPAILPQHEQLAYTKPKSIKPRENISAAQPDAPPPALNEIAIAANENLKNLPDSSLIEDRIMGYMADKSQDTVLGGGYVAVTKQPSALTVLKSKAEGADITVRPGKRTDNSPAGLINAGVPLNLVSGVVLSHADGLPLPGVSVKVVGKPQGTITDANGKFTLPNIKKEESIAFGSVGFNSKTLNVKNADSLKVELDQNSQSLSEVVVVKTTKRKLPHAHPRNGWDNFRAYLKDHATLSTGEEGIVTLQLTVNPDGRLAAIKIIKSLSEIADKQAVLLIQQGPTWIGNINGKPENIKVKVEFAK